MFILIKVIHIRISRIFVYALLFFEKYCSFNEFTFRSSSGIFDSNEGCMKGETVDFTTLEPKNLFIEI